MRRLLILLIVLLVAGCDEVSPKKKQAVPSPEVIEDVGFSGKYVKDGKGGLFNNVKWYYYSLINHVVWGLYDVYMIKTPTEQYRVQIVDYYGGALEESGQFVVRVQWAGGDEVVAMEAKGCGNVYTNPDFTACMADPERNVFTYLDLDTRTVLKMTDADALKDASWDLAFKGTDAKLNSGLSGPSTTVGAVLHRFPFFFENGTPSDSAVTQPELQAKAKADFLRVPLPEVIHYFLPDGIDRVIHENYWYTEAANGLRTAQDQTWWIVQSHDGRAFAKLRVASLTDVKESAEEMGFTTQLKLEWFVQEPGATTFANVPQTWSVDLSTTQKTTSLCLNLQTAVSAKCSSSDKGWEIKLVALNAFKDAAWTRDWRFFTSNGAYGPLTADEALAITEGSSLASQ